jgi:hypothetical protein
VSGLGWENALFFLRLLRNRVSLLRGRREGEIGKVGSMREKMGGRVFVRNWGCCLVVDEWLSGFERWAGVIVHRCFEIVIVFMTKREIKRKGMSTKKRDIEMLREIRIAV